MLNQLTNFPKDQKLVSSELIDKVKTVKENSLLLYLLKKFDNEVDIKYLLLVFLFMREID